MLLSQVSQKEKKIDKASALMKLPFQKDFTDYKHASKCKELVVIMISVTETHCERGSVTPCFSDKIY